MNTKKIVTLYLILLFIYMVTKYTTVPKDYESLVNMAKDMTKKSYAPYSAFHVGAAVLMSDGSVVTGCNQENAAYGESVCAERVAILYAAANYPHLKPMAIAIAAYSNGSFTEQCVTPCGSCRQVLSEMENRFKSPIKVVMYGVNVVCIADSVADLLPLTFCASSL